MHPRHLKMAPSEANVKRTALAVGAAFLLTMGCGGSPSPTVPARSDIPNISAGSSTAILPIDAPWADFGACLGGSGDAVCFSAARFLPALSAPAVAPGAPGTLTATVSGTTVTLVWSAPISGDPVVSYVIEAGIGPGLSNLANLTTNSATTTYSTSGVPNGTYYVRVRAQNSAGPGAVSNEVTVVVGGGTLPPTPGCTGPPSAPGGLTSTVTGNSVRISWNASSGSPTTYVVEAGTSSGSSNLASLDVGGTATSYTATAGNGTFYVRLRARNACGTSGVSNEITVVVNVAPPPTGGACTISRCSSTSVTYSCGTSTYSTNVNYCIVFGRVGPPSSVTYTFTNGRVVTCTNSCSGGGGQCNDGAGATCRF